MAKVALAAALFVAMMAFVTATTFTTTVTTTTIDEANPEYHQCQRQIQGRQFRSCQRFMKGRRSYNGEEEEDVLEMSTENPHQGSTSLTECCQQLRNINPECRCAAIQHAIRQSGSYQGQQMKQVFDRAQNLPRQCNFRQPQQCQIRAIFV